MIDILLSTYNGEEYLPEQIASVLAQTYTDWRLIIRDDGSTDSTLQYIQSLVRDYPDKVIFLKDKFGNIGAAQSFSTLMNASTAPYVAFCDQDDVWFGNKLEVQMEEMLRQEKRLGSDIPVLIHTDLVVVDQHLEVISNSFWKYQKLNPVKMNSIHTLLIHNYVTGCTCLINKKLIEIAMPIQKEAIMHDWWIAIVAVSNGVIVDLEKPTIYYRQHQRNDVGAKAWGMRYVYDLVFEGSAIRKALQNTKRQASALKNINCLENHNRKLIEKYVKLYEMGWISRHIQIFKLGIKKYGFIRNLAFLLFV